MRTDPFIRIHTQQKERATASHYVMPPRRKLRVTSPIEAPIPDETRTSSHSSAIPVPNDSISNEDSPLSDVEVTPTVPDIYPPLTFDAPPQDGLTDADIESAAIELGVDIEVTSARRVYESLDVRGRIISYLDNDGLTRMMRVEKDIFHSIASLLYRTLHLSVLPTMDPGSVSHIVTSLLSR